MRQCAYRIADHDPAVIENLLELRGGLGGLVRGQIGFTTHIDWIKRPEEPIKAAVRRAQVIWKAHVRPSRSGWPQAHSRKSLPTVPARFHPEPPCPAGPLAEPVPPHDVTTSGPLASGQNTPRQMLAITRKRSLLDSGRGPRWSAFLFLARPRALLCAVSGCAWGIMSEWDVQSTRRVTVLRMLVGS